MLPSDAKIISVDDHVVEHPRVWLDRLPEKYHEMAPQVVDLGEVEQWMFEGVVDGMTGLSAVVGTDLKERGLDPQRFEDMRKGCWDATARAEDLDLDRVAMEVLFPNYSGFAGSRFYRAKDKVLALACVKAYNDYVMEEWQDRHPDRFVASCILPLWDTTECEIELDRAIAKGFKSVAFADNPGIPGFGSFQSGAWDGVFARAAEAGLPLCMHFGGSGLVPPLTKDAPLAVQTAVMGATLFGSMTELLLSPVLHKFPNAKVVYAESMIGWLPFALQRIDQVWEHYRYYKVEPTINADVRPSDLFRRNMHACFIDDQVGVDMRYRIGVDNLMFESDYPHADSVWPATWQTAEKQLVDVPDDEARKLVELNARRVFNI